MMMRHLAMGKLVKLNAGHQMCACRRAGQGYASFLFCCPPVSLPAPAVAASLLGVLFVFVMGTILLNLLISIMTNTLDKAGQGGGAAHATQPSSPAWPSASLLHLVHGVDKDACPASACQYMRDSAQTFLQVTENEGLRMLLSKAQAIDELESSIPGSVVGFRREGVAGALTLEAFADAVVERPPVPF